MRLPDGNIDDLFTVEFQFQRFQGAAGGLNGFNSLVAAESVVQMNGKVADFDIRHIFKFCSRCFDEILFQFIAFADAVFAAQTGGEEFPFRQEQGLFCGKHYAARNMERHDVQIRRFGDLVFPEPFGNVFRIGWFAGGEDHVHAVVESAVDEVGRQFAGEFRDGVPFVSGAGTECRGDSDAASFR